MGHGPVAIIDFLSLLMVWAWSQCLGLLLRASPFRLGWSMGTVSVWVGPILTAGREGSNTDAIAIPDFQV